MSFTGQRVPLSINIERTVEDFSRSLYNNAISYSYSYLRAGFHFAVLTMHTYVHCILKKQSTSFIFRGVFLEAFCSGNVLDFCISPHRLRFWGCFCRSPHLFLGVICRDLKHLSSIRGVLQKPAICVEF